ncbi:bifunctional 4-hydroxy-2-oxoglutarate aldolase/2-dehydro-3-deoxy-phosphogluconate aldolase [Amycolatopsis taiwanensis]|uniref:bifunctional 4-hydroxy-2-oxoglutarate aldolase/2-dehydro-3-deoxy-phosphogluconate aldolase n=1 Tax=Amycolatopsis taiwanensis TaxID=342230 RepID=UPI0004810D5E|nr:bifunctional 4-hydroxy-2-oxoglutarate aldolase/2-dehydro-3-deoxy-phosphogluconate aldolase [Amycolatopsis taiwanensis]
MPGLLDISPVIPVLVLHDHEAAVPVVEALRDGGVRLAEVTLRTPTAIEAIRRIAAEVEDVLVGAGTVVAPHQAAAAAKAGAEFLVTPGSSEQVYQACRDTGLPILPGAATVSEAMSLAERGHSELKFFPAEAAGGPAYLRAIAGPLPDLRFCPTGGITAESASGYLRLPNVACVGGSWLTPAEAVAAGDFARITALTRDFLTACRAGATA